MIRRLTSSPNPAPRVRRFMASTSPPGSTRNPYRTPATGSVPDRPAPGDTGPRGPGGGATATTPSREPGPSGAPSPTPPHTAPGSRPEPPVPAPGPPPASPAATAAAEPPDEPPG